MAHIDRWSEVKGIKAQRRAVGEIFVGAELAGIQEEKAGGRESSQERGSIVETG